MARAIVRHREMRAANSSGRDAEGTEGVDRNFVMKWLGHHHPASVDVVLGFRNYQDCMRTNQDYRKANVKTIDRKEKGPKGYQIYPGRSNINKIMQEIVPDHA